MYLVTTKRNRYYVTPAAEIVRLDMPFSPSGQWRARAVYAATFGRFHRLADWFTFAAQAVSAGIPMRFKNGKPMYYLGDNDHGTDRIQGDGIISIHRATMNPDPDFVHNGKPYKYGSAWLKIEVPADVLAWLAALPDTDRAPAWV